MSAEQDEPSQAASARPASADDPSPDDQGGSLPDAPQGPHPGDVFVAGAPPTRGKAAPPAAERQDAPPAPEAPGTPGGGSGAPDATAAPGRHATPGNAPQGGGAVPPNDPGGPGGQGGGGGPAPGALGTPPDPGTPINSGTPADPGTPAGSGAPAGIGSPGGVAAPDGPGGSGPGGTPPDPGTPIGSGTPVDPGTPINSGTPAGPGGPVMPGNPVTPRGPVPGKRRRARVVGVAGAAALLVTAVAVTAGAVAGGGEAPKKKTDPTASAPPPAWTVAAGRALTSGTGLRYDGSLTVNGRPVQANLRVTPEGAATGTLAAGVLKADVVAIDGVTYIKAPPAFWQTYAAGVAHPEYYAGRWSKAPESMPGFDVPDVLGPEAIAEALAKAPAKPPTENVNGVRAYRVKLPGAEYLLAAAAPHKLLAVRPGGQTGPRFTVAPVAAPATLFAELRPRVARLGGAADPGLRFKPGTLTFRNCEQNTNGCTVSVPATLTSPAGKVPDGARAALRASITSEGRPLGSCTGSGPVPANRSLVLRCTVTSRLWRNWMRAALDHPGAYKYEATARVVGEALDVADVPELLARVDRERKEVVARAPSAPGPSVSAEPTGKRAERPQVATSRTPGTP